MSQPIKILKTTLLLSILSQAQFSQARPNENSASKMVGILKEQFDKELTKLSNLQNEHKKRLEELEASRVKAKKESIELSRREREGQKHFKSFANLLKIKYADKTEKKDGDFLEKAEIDMDDMRDINQIFSIYLNRIPLEGRVSAGIAVELLEDGEDELGDLISVHASPDEDNNSDLAIIAKGVEDTKNDLKIVAELEKKLKATVKFETAIASTKSPSDRAPASEASKESIGSRMR